jgi:hypothetical protein
MSKPIGIYEEIGAEIGRLVDIKQKAYGKSFNKSGQILKILYPHGIKMEQYDDLLAAARVLDKLFRIATDKHALGENPWQDIAGYGLLMCQDVPIDPPTREEYATQTEHYVVSPDNSWSPNDGLIRYGSIGEVRKQ